MSVITHWLQDGASMASGETFRGRLALRLGRWLATRGGDVDIHPTARISPDARINPRKGRIVIGARCSIAPGAIIQGNVTLGDDCSVQAYSILIGYGVPDDSAGRITLGNGVRVAPHVMMIAANHVFDDPDRPIHGQGLRHEPITIGDDVWIAGRVTITAGVTVGSGCVVGAGAVVTRDLPPRSVAVGVPARVVRQR